MSFAVENRTQISKSGTSHGSLSIPAVMFSCGFLLAAFLGIGSLTWPFGDDQGQYSFVGDTMWDGGVPYRDAWDLKGPLTYYLYGSIRALFGRTELSIRIFDLSVVSLFCWQLRSFVLRLNGRRVFGANLAVLFFLIEYFGSSYWFTAQPDAWGGMLILIAARFLLIEDNRSEYLNITSAALSLALATLLKPTFIIFLPLLMLYRGGARVLTPGNIRLFATGLAVVVLAISSSYAWVFRNGGTLDLIDAMRFAYSVYGTLSERLHPDRLFTGLSTLYELGLVIPYLLVTLGLWAMSRHGQMCYVTILGAWFGLSIIMLVYQGMYWHYEFIPATISASVSIGVLMHHPERWTERAIVRHLIEGTIFLVIGLICLAPLISSTLFGAFGWPSYVFGLTNRREYVAQIAQWWDARYEFESLSEYLINHTNQSDRVQMWGGGIAPLTLSQRRAASRFGTPWAVVGKTPMLSHYRSVFMSEIAKSLPRVIIVDGRLFNGDFMFVKAMREFSEFDRFVRAHYRLTSRLGEFQIWTLMGPEGSSSKPVMLPRAHAAKERATSSVVGQ